MVRGHGGLGSLPCRVTAHHREWWRRARPAFGVGCGASNRPSLGRYRSYQPCTIVAGSRQDFNVLRPRRSAPLLVLPDRFSRLAILSYGRSRSAGSRASEAPIALGLLRGNFTLRLCSGTGEIASHQRLRQPKRPGNGPRQARQVRLRSVSARGSEGGRVTVFAATRHRNYPSLKQYRRPDYLLPL
jgi:hypothetical protein